MKISRRLTVLLCAGLLSMPSWAADEHGTKEEAKAMTERAVEHLKKVGPDKAFKDFMEDKASWRAKDMYVFALTMNGVMLSHANVKSIGKDLSGYEDSSGKFYIKELAKVAQVKGSGWVEYETTNPQTKTPEHKVSYVVKMPNYDGFIGVGVYR